MGTMEQLNTAEHLSGWKDTGEGDHYPPSVSCSRTRVHIEVCLPKADTQAFEGP